MSPGALRVIRHKREILRSIPTRARHAFRDWRGSDRGLAGGGEDPWDSKASRWMGERGAALVRAGLLAWRQAQKEVPQKKAEGRRIGVMGVVKPPSWPDWVRDRSSEVIARSWKEHPPLWLLGCLPNLPVAQLAIEVGAKGPVETIRTKPGCQIEAIDRIRDWLAGRVDRVLWVEDSNGRALASVWRKGEA